MKFDGGIFTGRDPKTGDTLAAKQLKPYFDKFNLHNAISCDYQAIYDDMIEGNRRSLEIAKENPSLVPFAVINPLHYDISTSYLEELKAQGARGFLFAPKLQYWTYQHYNFKAAANRADKLGLPIQCLVSSPADLSWIAQALEFGKSPVLIRQMQGGGYSYLADQIALAKNCPQFYFDVSNLCQNGGIAYLCDRIGAERCYWASNAPANIETSSHLLVQMAPDLRESQKYQILSGTLSEIFGLAAKDSTLVLPQEWTKEISRPKIDTHWHSDGWDIIEPMKGFQKSIPYFEAFNEQIVFFSSIRSLNFDIMEGNLATFAELEKDQRFYGLLVVDPLRPEESLKLIQKYKNHPRFGGLKTIQDYYGPGLGLDDPAYSSILKWADENRSVVMAHIPGIARAAAQYPHAKFIAAHLTWDRLTKVLNSEGKVAENLYLDIATSHNSRSATQLKRLIETVGDDKILYSVDGPLMSPAWTIGKLIDANLSPSSLDKIYTKNALKLFSHLKLRLS